MHISWDILYARTNNSHDIWAICTSVFSFADDYDDCTGSVQILTSNYLSPGILINPEDHSRTDVIQKKNIRGSFFPITTDQDISTCIATNQEHKQLQAIFTFPNLPHNNSLSVEVILMNVDDCRSPAWTWFVESECNPGSYNECPSIQQNRVSELIYCFVTCQCYQSCGTLYLKYNRLPLRNQTLEQLCEIRVLWNGYRKWN